MHATLWVCRQRKIHSKLHFALQDSINFAIFSSAATAVSLCLFTEGDLQEGRVTHEVNLSADLNRTGDVWHIMLPRLDTSLLYGAQQALRLGPAVVSCAWAAHAWQFLV